jgi:hypothetical protein
MLIQCGTEQNSINGHVTYAVWYEMLPQSAIRIRSMSISPGDKMTATIQLINETTNQWQLKITDLTTKHTFQNTFTYNSSRLSAEWIVERPKVDKEFTTLIDFGKVTFTNCTTSFGSSIEALGSFPFSKEVMFTTISQAGQLTEVSSLVDGGSEFTVSYVQGE